MYVLCILLPQSPTGKLLGAMCCACTSRVVHTMIRAIDKENGGERNTHACMHAHLTAGVRCVDSVLVPTTHIADLLYLLVYYVVQKTKGRRHLIK